MPLSAKTVRGQLGLMQPLLNNCSLKTLRRGQNKLGELMEARHRRQCTVKEHSFDRFSGAWVMPKDKRRDGVILYLHGGGYTCGGLEYALGFGSALAAECGTRVFCAAYRLAPEAPFPAAVEDAVEAYRYLLDKGYSHITLCGESAGGGLCYALCVRLRELGLAMPKGIIAISPWVDLTLSGGSYTQNQKSDPSLTLQALKFFSDCYTSEKNDPLASPLFAELTGIPPSLIFTAAEELLRSDAHALHEKLRQAGCASRLMEKAERWHAYVVYTLAEDKKDLETINQFLSRVMLPERKQRWMRLDNAAKIYPAARSQNWSNIFRVSATLKEPVDTAVLRSALDVTVRRFPSIAARLRRGVFWYYLEQIKAAPPIAQEYSYPLSRMSAEEIRRCAFRVIVYENRIAIELFHSLTDGNGALVFLKTLLAEYLQQRCGVRIPAENGVLGRLEEPSEEELEDSFPKYAGPVSASRKENTAWHLSGTTETDGFNHLTCFRLPVAAVLEKAHEYGVSLTVFLTAAMMQALQDMQRQQVPRQNRRKPIKVLIPVNLRNLFPSRTLRNFALYVTPEIQPELGEYSFSEICSVIRHRLGVENTAKQMSMKIATNVSSERIFAVKLMPLFLKNIVMKAVFRAVGEKKSCLSLSNLGAVKLPEGMEDYIERMDFILGVQATAPYNCGVLSFGDTLYVNVIRNIRESELEANLHRVLRDMGIPVQVESNSREE
ncbi:MAG: alpha/beta hydrolase [Oscillospiraceae bacterium]|nr:alpha/beta hydrolase [Oscillospiraceae bacterium]